MFLTKSVLVSKYLGAFSIRIKRLSNGIHISLINILSKRANKKNVELQTVNLTLAIVQIYAPYGIVTAFAWKIHESICCMQTQLKPFDCCSLPCLLYADKQTETHRSERKKNTRKCERKRRKNVWGLVWCATVSEAKDRVTERQTR